MARSVFSALSCWTCSDSFPNPIALPGSLRERQQWHSATSWLRRSLDYGRRRLAYPENLATVSAFHQSAPRAAYVEELFRFVAPWALELDVLSRYDSFWFFHQGRVEPLRRLSDCFIAKYMHLQALREARFSGCPYLVAISHLPFSLLKTEVKSGTNTRDHKCFCHIAALRTR